MIDLSLIPPVLGVVGLIAAFVVYGVVKDFDGYVDVRTRVGQGTEFRVWFPATSA